MQVIRLAVIITAKTYLKGMTMKKTLSKKQRFFNRINLTTDDEVYVGIDVHKKNCHIAVRLNGALALTFVAPSDNIAIAQMMGKLNPAIKKIVYEAGPTGFSLARALEKASLPIAVIAPSKTPRPSAQQAKSDRLDCKKLAEYAEKDLLFDVTIPDRQQEDDRQVVRLRNQLVAKRTRIKHQIKSFLLQHNIPEPHGLDDWTKQSIVQLRNIELCPQLRFTLDVMLDELNYLQTQIKRVQLELKNIYSKERHIKQIEILQSHPGVGPVTARQFRAEVFNPERFDKSTQLTRYLGLCPHVSQSGQKRIDGRLMKAGQINLRKNLIEAAWTWTRIDPDAKETFKRLLANTGEKNKAIVGMARRLAIHLWKMLCDEQPYRKAA
jgi:transposase